MADKGFTICNHLGAVGVNLNMPSFVKGGEQLADDQVLHTRKIASVGNHVECTVGRIKISPFLETSY